MRFRKIPLLAAALALIAVMALPVSADMRKGSTGEDVEELQQLLLDCGWLFEEPDGSFGERTEAAVKAYQEYAGFEPNGVVDAAVMQQLRKDRAVLFGEDEGYWDEEDGGASNPLNCDAVTGTQYLMTELCVDHDLTNEKMLGVLSEDPEDTERAAALWEAEVQALFEKKLQNSSAGDKLLVMAEHAAFKAYAQDYRAALMLRWPEDDTMVDLGMMNLYEDQAVLLCGLDARSGDDESTEGQGF